MHPCWYGCYAELRGLRKHVSFLPGLPPPHPHPQEAGYLVLQLSLLREGEPFKSFLQELAWNTASVIHRPTFTPNQRGGPSVGDIVPHPSGVFFRVKGVM